MKNINGDVLLGKTFTLDPISKKRIVNKGEEDQYYIKEHHQGIISREMFDKAQAILSERSKCRDENRLKGNYSRRYAFSSKLRCGYCGAYYCRKNMNSGHKKSNRAWECMTVVKKGRMFCNHSKIIREDLIEDVFVDTYNLLLRNEKSVLNKFIERVEKCGLKSKYEADIKKCQKNMEILKKKTDNLFELLSDESITKEYFAEKNAELTKELDKEERKLDKLLMERENNDVLANGINKITSMFEGNAKLKEFDEDLFKTVIKYVIIGEDDDSYTMRFIIKNGNEISSFDEDADKLTILEFESKQKYYSFEPNEKGFKNKVQRTGIKVRVEMEI